MQLTALANQQTPEAARADSARARHQAVLTCSAGGPVELVLRGANGERIADRTLAPQGRCADLASAIAVMVGAWEADLDPHVAAAVALPAPVAVELQRPSALPPSDPTAPASTRVVAAQEARDALAIAPPPPRLPATARPIPATLAHAENRGPSPAPKAAASKTDASVTLGLLGAVTGGEISPGATIAGDLFQAGARLGLAAGLTGTLPREASVGSLSNVARWFRVTLSLGPELRLNLERTRIDLQVAAVAALLHIAGTGLSSTSSDTTLQRGVALGASATRAGGAVAVWAGVHLLVFPGDDRLIVNGVAAQGHLPQIELQIAWGISFGRSR